MAQREIEVILARQLAEYLSMPIFIVDPGGSLIFYNEPAELILGCRFEDTGSMPASKWSTLFTPTDERGNRLPPEVLPLMIALKDRKPANRKFWIQGLDGVRHYIGVTAFPLIGQASRFLGAVALFWEDSAQ